MLLLTYSIEMGDGGFDGVGCKLCQSPVTPRN